MSIRNLSKDFAFYGMLDFLQRSLAILLVPIYTRVLTQNRYGELDLILTVGAALTVLVDLQFVAAFSRLYLAHRNAGEGPRFVGTTVLARAAVGTMLAGLFVGAGFAGGLEFRFIPSFRANATAWVLVAIAIPVSFVYDILLVQTQMLRAKRWFFIGAFGNALLSTLLCIVFTVPAQLGIVGVLLGQFVGKTVMTVVLLIGMRREIKLDYRTTIVAEVARYALPLVPGWWVTFSSAYISRFFIYAGQGAQENAILAITTKVAAVLAMFCVAFRTAWQPLAMSYIGEEAGEAFYVRSLRAFIGGGLVSLFALTVLSRPALAILAPASYGVADRYVPLFLIASLIGDLDVNLQLGNQISKKTYWISIAGTVGFAVNLTVLIILVPRLGIYAAGIGLLAAFAARVVITWFSGQRNYPISYDRRSLGVFAFGCMALLILTVARNAGVLVEPLFVAVVALLGLTLPWLTLDTSERQLVKDWTLTRWASASRR